MRNLFFLFLFLPLILVGQDSTKILSQEKLQWFIKNYHPVAVQGTLILASGESKTRQARGGFDPYLESDLNQKYFDSKNYFSLLNAGLKVPTWYGVELKTGYDQNTGQFLNPENNLPSDGLWYAGISVPIGQGLIIDKRRAALKQAEIFSESTAAQQRQLMNNLYFEAFKTYWYWVEAYNAFLVYEESVDLAQIRFEGIVQSYQFGDKPAIDTLEAYIQIQNRQISLKESELAYQKATLNMSNYLWFENNTPLVITAGLRPPKLNEIKRAPSLNGPRLDSALTALAFNHPELVTMGFQLESLDIDRRLKAEGLKPKLNLNYNALNAPAGDDFLGNYAVENYKWGFEFSFPLLLRAQRGELELAKIKIRDTELKQQQKLLTLQNKVRSYYVEQVNLENQLLLVGDVVKSYNGLLNGEKQKFNSGESSLFLINSRENSLIKAKIKQNQLTSKYWIAHNGVAWATGELGWMD